MLQHALNAIKCVRLPPGHLHRQKGRSHPHCYSLSVCTFWGGWSCKCVVPVLRLWLACVAPPPMETGPSSLCSCPFMSLASGIVTVVTHAAVPHITFLTPNWPLAWGLVAQNPPRCPLCPTSTVVGLRQTPSPVGET